MNTKLTIQQPQTFVAVSPSQLPGAQLQVASWCRAKIIDLSQQLREERENLRQAKQLKWKHSGWSAAANRTCKRMVYYAKLQMAVRAGYLIVPNFDVDVIAVRVNRKRPPEPTGVHEATTQVLTPGEGHYVDDTLKGYTTEEPYTDQHGVKHVSKHFHSTHYNPEIDFPVTMAHPSILEATDRAMALRLFDRIGIVRKGRRSDPIVVGQIINPKETSPWTLRMNPKCVTFFIAWWLDTKDL